jgi:hypothetical protein
MVDPHQQVEQHGHPRRAGSWVEQSLENEHVASGRQGGERPAQNLTTA